MANKKMTSGIMGNKSKSKVNALQLKIGRERRKIKAIGYIFPLMTLLLFAFTFKNSLMNSEAPIFFRVIWALALGLLFPARGATGRTMDLLLETKDPQIEKLRTVYKVFNILSILILSLLIFPIIYYSPLPEKISAGLELAKSFSNFAVSYISNAITVLLSGLSGYISNIILGVLGNLVYDIGKILFRRLELSKKKTAKRKVL